MARKETVKVEGEDVERELLDRFEKAIANIEENDRRHVVPEFLKAAVDPVKEYKKFRRELRTSLSLLGGKKKRAKSSKA